jgi:hypothetical protein
VNLYEIDAAPAYKQNKVPICSYYCAAEPRPNEPPSCDYSGPCSPIYNDVDVSPNPGAGSGSSGGGWGSPPVSSQSGITAFTLVLEYDMATGIITGDKAAKRGVAVSKKGTPMTISGTDPSRRASITLTID